MLNQQLASIFGEKYFDLDAALKRIGGPEATKAVKESVQALAGDIMTAHNNFIEGMGKANDEFTINTSPIHLWLNNLKAARPNN